MKRRQPRARVTPSTRVASAPTRPSRLASNHFTSTEYDDLDRPVHVLLPDGGSIETSHEGLVTLATDPDGGRTRSERNARGQVASTTAGFGTDDASTTRYVYGPFGALQTVTDHAGNGSRVETDAWGRRTELGGILDSIARRRTASEDGELYWRLLSVWPDGQIRMEERGNGLVSTREQAQDSGRLQSIHTAYLGSPTHERPATPRPTDPVVQHLRYEWTQGGNLHKREDVLLGHTEEFEYDGLARLRFSHVRPQGDTEGSSETRYDALGNVTYRTHLGAYQYKAPRAGGGFLAHAASHAGGIELRYDAVGRLERRIDRGVGLDQEVRHFHFGKPSYMGGTRQEPAAWYEYDADGARLVRETAITHTTTLGDLYERVAVVPGATPPEGQPADLHRFLVHAGSRLVAQVTRRIEDPRQPAARAEETLWVNDDHLGSTHVISRARGAVVETRSFDAFGRPRRPAWSDPGEVDPMSSLVPRGFTGHQDDTFGLVNMGGRIYDPSLARFLQPDPFVQQPGSEGLNRYSYVANNPLSRVDPSGFLVRSITAMESDTGCYAGGGPSACGAPAGFDVDHVPAFTGSGGLDPSNYEALGVAGLEQVMALLPIAEQIVALANSPDVRVQIARTLAELAEPGVQVARGVGGSTTWTYSATPVSLAVASSGAHRIVPEVSTRLADLGPCDGWCVAGVGAFVVAGGGGLIARLISWEVAAVASLGGGGAVKLNEMLQQLARAGAPTTRLYTSLTRAPEIGRALSTATSLELTAARQLGQTYVRSSPEVGQRDLTDLPA